MVQRRRIDSAEGRAALEAWWADGDARQNDADLGKSANRDVIATAVRFTLEELAARAPGNSVEMRVPPFGATQCVQGPRHTRGTPPSAIETDPATWLSLASGMLTWENALEEHRLSASGERTDFSGLLPLFPRRSSHRSRGR